MLLAGVTAAGGKCEIADLICSIMNHARKKISIIDLSTFFSDEISSGDFSESGRPSLDREKLKDYLRELDRNGTHITLIKINSQDLELGILETLKLDMMILDDGHLHSTCSDFPCNGREEALSLLKEKGLAIINLDNDDFAGMVRGMKNEAVTYGFNPRASITASSVGDTFGGGDAATGQSFICYLQKTIQTKSGVVLPQEFVIRHHREDLEPCHMMAAATFAIMNGVEPAIIDVGHI